MRRHWAAFFVALTVALGTSAAFADHFDGDASTGSFNPQLGISISNNVVDRPSTSSANA